MPYRLLTTTEIGLLTAQGCTADDWTLILVKEGFSTRTIQHVHFTGTNRLGLFAERHTLPDGTSRPSGIYHASLHNCTVGDNTYIGHIKRHIAHYDIAENCFLEDLGCVTMTGQSHFGNGQAIHCLSEMGDTQVVIYDRLSTALAAIQLHYPTLSTPLQDAIGQYAETIASTRGTIQEGCIITSCQHLEDLRIGAHTHIDGALRLADGSINSTLEAPIYIGNGVIAKHFILSAGAQIDESALLEHCFVGQASQVSKQFSLYDSVLMSNCQALHGEGCAIFGGPYTVTHHKSTLLIGGEFSFYNAGSATNQSNHQYKLGPMHHGYLARGCKTASGSYLLWPAKIGAFTLVMGHHYEHPNTLTFPFSYLVEQESISQLIPAINLHRVGTWRDAAKWPQRDNRPQPALDTLHFDLLTPYTGQQIYQAIQCLQGGSYAQMRPAISEHAAQRALPLYQEALALLLGKALIQQLKQLDIQNVDDLYAALWPNGNGTGPWVDLAGTLVPEHRILHLATLASLPEIENAIASWKNTYTADAWSWAVHLAEQLAHKPYNEFQITDFQSLLQQYQASLAGLKAAVTQDAAKEIAQPEQHPFLQDFNQQLDTQAEEAMQWMTRLTKIV